MKVNVFHVEGALPYVLSAHETTTIRFSEKRVWSLQAQIQIVKEPELFYAVYLDLCYMGIGVYAEKENC